MKRLFSVTLALIMVFSMFSVLAEIGVFAENEDNGITTPDDAFEGEYTEFKGNDGSITKVFDNGSVSTKNKDGSIIAVDYKGNQYSEDTAGNSTVRTTDGYVATEYKDGRQSLTEPNGKTTTLNTDGSFSESYGVGLTLDYDEDGKLTGIGITGNDQRIGTDQNGCYKNGEITCPDGSKLKITDDGMEFINKDGTSYNHTDLGNKQTTSIDWKDGSHAESETNITWDGGKKTENTDFSLTDSEGNRWDSNINTSYDSNGKPEFINNHVTKWTGADGSKLWMDNNSKAIDYSDKDGNIFKTDSNGNLTEYKDGENAWNVEYDQNGNVKTADITYSDGAKLIKNADGTTTFTLPDGTKYESDGKGNITRDGEIIKKDGKWTNNKNSGNNKDKTDNKGSEKSGSSKGKSTDNGGSAKTGATMDDMMGSWSYTDGSITEKYTFTRSGDSITVVLVAVKSDGTASNPVTFACEYTFDGTTLTITNSKWHDDMKLRLIDKNRLEVTSSGTFVMTREGK